MKLTRDGWRIGFGCPECGKKMRVIDTRGRFGDGILRRRECPRGHRVNTVEMLADQPGQGRSFGAADMSAATVAPTVRKALSDIDQMLVSARKRIAKAQLA